MHSARIETVYSFEGVNIDFIYRVTFESLFLFVFKFFKRHLQRHLRCFPAADAADFAHLLALRYAWAELLPDIMKSHRKPFVFLENVCYNVFKMSIILMCMMV